MTNADPFNLLLNSSLRYVNEWVASSDHSVPLRSCLFLQTCLKREPSRIDLAPSSPENVETWFTMLAEVVQKCGALGCSLVLPSIETRDGSLHGYIYSIVETRTLGNPLSFCRVLPDDPSAQEEPPQAPNTNLLTRSTAGLSATEREQALSLVAAFRLALSAAQTAH